jgi:hypothetical protein
LVELISVHIPKTAGMSFRNVLEQVYEPEKILLDHDFPFDGSNIESEIRVIHGHFWVSKYAGYFEAAKRIVWFRNPIYRVLSHYFFLKTHPGPEVRPDLAVLGLLEFAEHPQIRNTMSQFTQGVDPEDFYFIGIQEFFAEDLTDLSGMLGWNSFKQSVTNSNRYPEYTGHLYKILESREILKKLMISNSEDVELYELALSLRSKRRRKALSQTAASLAVVRTLDGFSQSGTHIDTGIKILSEYVPTASCIQNALNIFKGEWVSRFPGDLALLEAGQVPSFEDARISWAIAQLGGVKGQRILELGPLEAGNTHMLEQAEAELIIAVEANPHAYLKCLIVKEILRLSRAQFLCSDYVRYLRLSSGKFDVCFANGILYHVENPAELMALMAKTSDRIFIWTHYYEKKLLQANSRVAHTFIGETQTDYEGFEHTLYQREDPHTLTPNSYDTKTPYSSWMTREQIIDCLRYFGLEHIHINFDESDHPNGPSMAIVATRY